MMKHKTTLMSALTLAAGLTCTHAAVVAVTSDADVANPFAGGSVVKAVNVDGGAVVTTTNSIAFEADTALPAGNGYTPTSLSSEGSTVTITPFSNSTRNITGAGSFNGTQITLLANTDYKFEIYFSDNNAGRSAIASYSLGGGAAITETVVQTNDLTRFEVTFNSGSSTTLDWDVLNPDVGVPSAGHAKVSAYALYQAAPVPEPSSTALLGLGGLALILRRRK